MGAEIQTLKGRTEAGCHAAIPWRIDCGASTVPH
jgi:hypothetical protein